MTIEKVHENMRTTDICAFSKKDWNKETRMISMKFNGVLYPKFIAMNNSDYVGTYTPKIEDLLSHDFISIPLTLEEKADYFKRFYIFSTNANMKKEVIPKVVSSKEVEKVEKPVNDKKETTEVKVSVASGARRETALSKKSKFRTGIHFVSMHYSFGSQSQAPMDMKAFAFRAGRRASKHCSIEIKTKDFELNDIGLINGRFYIDQEIRQKGYDMELYFAQADYEFIKFYGPRMWIKVTGYKSGFAYDEYTREVIERYYDVNHEHTIVKSFSKRLIVDHNPYFESATLDSRLIAELSNFKS